MTDGLDYEDPEVAAFFGPESFEEGAAIGVELGAQRCRAVVRAATEYVEAVLAEAEDDDPNMKRWQALVSALEEHHGKPWEAWSDSSVKCGEDSGT